MRVCFVSRDAAWQKYRGETLGRLGRQLGREVEIVTVSPIAGYLHDSPGVKYVSFPSWLPRRWSASLFPGAIRHVLRSRPDVVLAVNNLTHLTEYCLFLCCKLAGIPFVWWTHGYDHVARPGSVANRVRRWVMLQALKRSDGVITFSQAGHDYLLSAGLPPGMVEHAPNTLDTDALRELARSYGRAERERWCASLGLAPDRRWVVFLGRLTALKRPPLVLEAFATLQRRHPEVGLVIVGDGPLRNQLQEDVQRRALQGVRFEGARFDDVDVARYCAVADLALMPCGLGLSIVHLFAFGVPIVTTGSDTHGPEAQYLVDGENALVIESDDADALARSAERVLDDPALQARMSASATATALGPANVHRMVDAMARCLTRAVGK